MASPRWLLAATALTLGSAALAQAPAVKAGTGIYTCTDDKGHRLTSDRPIAECSAKEQQLLNRDGSLRAVIPPTLTADERTEKEARERAAIEARTAAADAVRRDRNLMARFPTEAAHNRAREAALDSVRLAAKASEIRLRELAAERKPLLDEAEFYIGKPLPPRLKAAIEANDASAEAQRMAGQGQEAELARVNKLYDAELERLRRLWSGSQPGSLGLLPPSAAPASTGGAASSGAPRASPPAKPAPK
jgi:hypothetical protein